MILSLWWVWALGALALGILELLVPGYLFLGFAIGAALTAGVTLLFPGLAAAPLLVIFALLSGLGWWLLRRRFGHGPRDEKIIRHDINEN